MIATRLDELINEREEYEKKNKQELMDNNWIDGEIDSVFKFPNSPTIKITFTQTVLA